MAIPIRQQVVSIEGLILGAVSGVECPRCSHDYVDLRTKKVKVSRAGLPAPFVALSWGEERRKEAVLAALRDALAGYERDGLERQWGAIRCPHCRLGVQDRPDPAAAPNVSLFRATGVGLGLLVAVVVLQIAKAMMSGPPGEVSTNAGAVALVAFAVVLVAAYAVYLRRDGAARRLMDQPAAMAPKNALTSEEWTAIEETAAKAGVDPTGLWFATSRLTIGRQLANLDSWPVTINTELRRRGVLWILASRSESEVLYEPESRP